MGGKPRMPRTAEERFNLELANARKVAAGREEKREAEKERSRKSLSKTDLELLQTVDAAGPIGFVPGIVLYKKRLIELKKRGLVGYSLLRWYLSDTGNEALEPYRVKIEPASDLSKADYTKKAPEQNDGMVWKALTINQLDLLHSLPSKQFLVPGGRNFHELWERGLIKSSNPRLATPTWVLLDEGRDAVQEWLDKPRIGTMTPNENPHGPPKWITALPYAKDQLGMAFTDYKNQEWYASITPVSFIVSSSHMHWATSMFSVADYPDLLAARRTHAGFAFNDDVFDSNYNRAGAHGFISKVLDVAIAFCEEEITEPDVKMDAEKCPCAMTKEYCPNRWHENRLPVQINPCPSCDEMPPLSVCRGRSEEVMALVTEPEKVPVREKESSDYRKDDLDHFQTHLFGSLSEGYHRCRIGFDEGWRVEVVNDERGVFRMRMTTEDGFKDAMKHMWGCMDRLCGQCNVYREQWPWLPAAEVSFRG